ncbi:tetratricopeptide repeat protein [Nitratireductor luteus]|uniref:tetratricopeptide repeat protein n=1 Tax=Nitratireductor luteus TaxID=2976980 RepID=UPI0022407775|nr:tetratricopeptide repeat protein [Nitratireductor luteus]
MMQSLRFALGAVVLAAALAGCQTAELNSDGVVRTNEPAKLEFTAFGDAFDGLKTISDVDYYASDQAVAAAKNQFRQENYGNAGALFYKAVRLAPNDGEAWLGLAAASDRIGRFDLADKAYREAYRLVGSTAAYYNNVGYSHLLRGNLVEARRNFLKAYELAPNDPTVTNNLELLASSARSIQR